MQDKIVFEDMVKTLAKPGKDILATLTPEKVDLWHMATGFVGEAGELLASIDEENDIEELGDFEFYLEGTRNNLNIERQNIDFDFDVKQLDLLKTFLMVGATELFDLIKKHVIYNKDLDIDAVNLSILNIEKQLAAIYNFYGITRNVALEENIKKLGKRYEGLKYSDQAAQDRADKQNGEK